MRTDQDTSVGSTSLPDALPGASRPRGIWRRLLSGLAWLVLALVVLAGFTAALTEVVELPIDALAIDQLPVSLSGRIGAAGAVTLTIVLTGLTAHRAGSRTVIATVFAACSSVAAVLGGWSWLLAGVVALTAFVSAVLAVVATRPARRTAGILGEYVVAVSVAVIGAVAVAAYEAPVRPMLLTDLVSLAAVGGTLWVAYRLGGGFNGLGRRGAVVLVSAVAVLVLGIAYSEALRRWGSPGVVDAISDVTRSTRDLLGALPPPLEILIGFPALVWGLGTRAHLRQGWWVCAFGALATAGVTTSLADPRADLGQELLGTGYAAAIGLVIGLVLWRFDLRLTGQRHKRDRRQGHRRGRRARRAERAQPMRPEPSRTRPLM